MGSHSTPRHLHEKGPVYESHVETAKGDIFAARLVIDARGASELPAGTVCGYMKFMAREYKLKGPHGLSKPLLIDANCPQLDGLRFFRLFPIDENRVRLEETFCSESPVLNRERLHRSMAAYIERQGWSVESVERDEEAVLVLPMTKAYLSPSIGGEPLPIGLRGGYFHAQTGYSLPDAVRVAEFLSGLEDLVTSAARERLLKFRRSWLSKQRFYRLINRFMFYASESPLRYQVLQSLYEQPHDVISRFNAGRSTWTDRMRILLKRPQVPTDRALKSLTEKSIQAWAEARIARQG
jgi:lycopene beta-cyclase